MTQITYPSGRVVDYTLDSQGRPQAIHTRDHDQAAPDTLIDNIHYRPFGPPEAYDYGNGLNHQRDYDLDYRLTQIQVSGTEPLLSRQYQYDAAGNITAINNPVNPQASQSFAYDALDRLTQADGLYGQESFTYDPVGNRLSRSHQSPNTNTQIEENYGYASDSHRLLYLDQSTDGLPSLTRDFVYDEAGNPIQRTGADGAEQGFTYNAANRMAQAEIDYQVTAQYTYNALGQRVRKTVDGLPEPTESLVSEVPGAQGRLQGLENQRAAAQRRLERLQAQLQRRPARHHDRLQSQIDDQRERLAHIDEQIGELTHTPGPDIPPEQITHYNEQGQRLGDYTDTGEPLREYLYFDSLLVGLVDYTDNPQGILYHIHNDHLGTPQMATDASQQIVWQGDYHPFGKVIPNANNTINLLPRFPGQYSDGETGLYYNYFRDYDPSIGRYVQSDPIGLAGGINTYAYVQNNPLVRMDPLGLFCIPLPSVKTDWEDVGPVTHREHAVLITDFFNFSVCRWRDLGDQRQKRTVQNRKLCYRCETENCEEDCSFRVEKSDSRVERRTINVVIDSQRTVAGKTNYGFGGNKTYYICKNPWTRRTHTFSQ